MLGLFSTGRFCLEFVNSGSVDLLIHRGSSVFLGIMAEPETEPECPICLKHPTNSTNLSDCRHIFCRSCISIWAKMNNSCPICKAEFVWIFDSNDQLTKIKSTRDSHSSSPSPDPDYDVAEGIQSASPSSSVSSSVDSNLVSESSSEESSSEDTSPRVTRRDVPALRSRSRSAKPAAPTARGLRRSSRVAKK